MDSSSFATKYPRYKQLPRRAKGPATTYYLACPDKLLGGQPALRLLPHGVADSHKGVRGERHAILVRVPLAVCTDMLERAHKICLLLVFQVRQQVK